MTAEEEQKGTGGKAGAEGRKKRIVKGELKKHIHTIPIIPSPTVRSKHKKTNEELINQRHATSPFHPPPPSDTKLPLLPPSTTSEFLNESSILYRCTVPTDGGRLSALSSAVISGGGGSRLLLVLILLVWILS